MKGESPAEEPTSPELTAEERLDSWKEIAAYLKRDVRTVHRWEADEGLPVHRHLHKKRGTVYAYKSELDEWIRQRAKVADAGAGPAVLEAPTATGAGWRRPVALAVLGAVAIIVAGLGWVVPWRSAPRFQESDWVLITTFDNRTGESLLDSTVDYALGRELANFLNVVSRERVEDTLRLMKLPPDTRVDAALGRELCLRDGGIQALVVGRVERIGTRYVVSSQLVDVDRGRTIWSTTAEADSRASLLPAVGRLAAELARPVAPEKAARIARLPRISTRSLSALRLYAEAQELARDQNYAAAAELLKSAIKEDPEFALAHLQLAWAHHWLGSPRDAVSRYASRALQLAQDAPEAELLLIRGGYHILMREFSKAKATCEALLRLHPDHYEGLSQMVILLEEMYLPEVALPYSLRMAATRPHSFSANQLAAQSLVALTGNRQAAEPYLQRLRHLDSPEWQSQRPYDSNWLHFLTPFERWVAGDVEPLRQALEQGWAVLDGKTGPERDSLAAFLGHLYMAHGDAERAELAFQRIGQSTVRQLALGRAALLGRRVQNIAGILRGIQLRGEHQTALAAVLWVRAGDARTARALLGTAPPSRPSYTTIAFGELALAEGKSEEAVRLLREGLPLTRSWGTALYYLGTEALARAWLQRGNVDEAVRVLQDAASHPLRAYPWRVAEWMYVKSRLANVYRGAGRRDAAERLEHELQRLCPVCSFPKQAVWRAGRRAGAPA